jgi:hypothetical protein
MAVSSIGENGKSKGPSYMNSSSWGRQLCAQSEITWFRRRNEVARHHDARASSPPKFKAKSSHAYKIIGKVSAAFAHIIYRKLDVHLLFLCPIRQS